MSKKKIVITGSESFIGKELISQLKTLDYQIIGFDSISPKNPQYEFHQTDIRDIEIHKLIPEDTDVLIHLAALSRDPDCKNRALECFDVNVMGTLNLIQSSILKNIKQFIFASSEWVYDEFKKGEVKDENYPINSQNLTSEYALSKLTSEINLHQQFLHDSCDITILRFGIIYGPRKSNWSAVESIFNTIKNQTEVTVGSLKTGRRFVHVSDIANGIIHSLELRGFNIINLSGEKIETLGDIIKTSEEIFGKKVDIIETSPDKISIRNPSNSKAKKIIGWKPKIDLKMGLKTLME